ncbi:MarR family transcriptional regulator [Ruegeria sp. SCSIO 43209]|uniref:MarR family winged helix-turn-helix transcriptional regulator n=1 Tax=Ruegeria sp. SCSIO 43209 TaxID=2793010 RepID=UPI00147D4A48|nr:MarR family transcriptional regulator [Ruegeria sp. SCSIO 43209]UAB88235.1 MarR family transcriptional regulator [Ruegeria sp. SCSIO 43209]
MDHIDRIISQWNKARPDLDVGPMETIGRLSRLAAQLRKEMDKTWKVYGLNLASFDVLATLRRSGKPEGLSPGELLDLTMVTSGTMTNRIDQLVKAGLVERAPNPEDKRGFLIRLTRDGFSKIENAVSDHVETQHRLMNGLSPEQRDNLNGLLKALGEAVDEDTK